MDACFFSFLTLSAPFGDVYVSASPGAGKRGIGKKKKKKLGWGVGGEKLKKKELKECACAISMEIDTNNDLLEWRMYNDLACDVINIRTQGFFFFSLDGGITRCENLKIREDLVNDVIFCALVVCWFI